jgi:hypothetical protein
MGALTGAGAAGPTAFWRAASRALFPFVDGFAATGDGAGAGSGGAAAVECESAA